MQQQLHLIAIVQYFCFWTSAEHNLLLNEKVFDESLCRALRSWSPWRIDSIITLSSCLTSTGSRSFCGWDTAIHNAAGYWHPIFCLSLPWYFPLGSGNSINLFSKSDGQKIWSPRYLHRKRVFCFLFVCLIGLLFYFGVFVLGGGWGSFCVCTYQGRYFWKKLWESHPF